MPRFSSVRAAVIIRATSASVGDSKDSMFTYDRSGTGIGDTGGR
jgi:hypothetical protein